ncbi:MAG: T9SS type A sorting domain-containing protein, partial [Sphingobacteriales bacterium]
TYSITDVSGKQVGQGAATDTIDISALSPGLYWLRVANRDGSRSSSFSFNKQL